MRPRFPWLRFLVGCFLLALVVSVGMSACSAGNGAFDDDDDGTSQTTTGGGGDIGFDAGTGGSGLTGDPKTCEDAALARTYMGCDFWPTVTANNVWSIFDFAVVVANTGDNVVDATVTRGGAPVSTAQIQPNSLATIYLPWVPELKGPDADMFGSATPVTQTIRVANGAYHLETTYPVTVYQFNALEYQGVGGPPGKSWAGCPGDLSGIGCFSFSNDASLLIPSTAWTGNYRVTSIPGWPIANMGTYIAITGLTDGTTLNIHVSATGGIVAGGGLNATAAGQTANTTINRGEVLQVLAPPTSDLSGTWVEAGGGAVQVIAGIPCRYIPDDMSACDHLEESVFPAETLGQHYVVTRPTGPHGTAVGHLVRIYGNVDGTTLTYPSGVQPPGAPTAIGAGQVIDLGVVNVDFEIEGSQAFAVGTFQQGASVVDPGAPVEQQKGDPAHSLSTAVEQYRTKYVFLGPLDYDTNFVDIVLPAGTQVSIDGAPIGAAPEAIGSSGYAVARVQLGPGVGGAHLLEASAPVGIQVSGYGSYTSYYYPGGLDLEAIAPPPVK